MKRVRSLWCLLLVVMITSLRAKYLPENARDDKHTIDMLLMLRNNPHVQAFLETIAFAEGTFNHFRLKNDMDGYRVIYGYEYFDDFTDHPRRIISKGNYSSSASGRYQFLKGTWDELRELVLLPDFGPVHQDCAAIKMFAIYRALADVLADRFEQAITKVNTVWASLPGSPYGQPTKRMDVLKAFYQDRLARHKARQRSGRSLSTKKNKILRKSHKQVRV